MPPLALDKEPFRVAKPRKAQGGSVRSARRDHQHGCFDHLDCHRGGDYRDGVGGGGWRPAAAGMISMAAGAYLGSRAEEDVRESRDCRAGKGSCRKTRGRAGGASDPVPTGGQHIRRSGCGWRIRSRTTNPCGSARCWRRSWGISPDLGGNPLKDAAVMCVSFGSSAIIPILPFLFLDVGLGGDRLVHRAIADCFVWPLAWSRGGWFRSLRSCRAWRSSGLGAASAGLGYLLGEWLPRLLGF